MTTLKLLPWNVNYARQKMNELLEPQPNFACWVGSVSLNSPLELSEFMEKARLGDVRSLIKYQKIGGDMLYAVLLNMPNLTWKLVVIESPQSPSVNERPVFSIIVPDISVEVSNRKMDSIKQKLRRDSRLSFRDLLKEYFNFKVRK